MTAYYNDNDPKACAWMRELAKEGHITYGRVDERSIADVRADELSGFTRAHFFAGIGGWDYALRLAGWPDDVPVWTGSCPCQPFSAAGKGLGTSDHRHLWPELRRLIAERRPPVVFGEQVASRAGRDWLAAVRADLEALGYAVGAADLCAASVGAPHIRQRLFWCSVADSHGSRRKRLEPSGGFVSDGSWGWRGQASVRLISENPFIEADCWPQPLLRKVDDGVPARVGRLRGYGNAIVPQVAAAFVKAFMEACR